MTVTHTVDATDTDPFWAQSLAEYLGVASVGSFRKLSGGASRETWSFAVDTADGGVARRVIQIVRRIADHDLGLEVAVLRAASSSGVPVARVIAFDAGEQVVGAPFVVSEHIDGEALGPRIVRHSRYSAARHTLASTLGECLARIHGIEGSIITELPQPPDILQVVRSEIDANESASPVAELVLSWLERHRPPTPDVQRFVHGDFRVGNLLVGDDGLRAVLDWELAHVGDPAEDLGWLCVRAWRYGGRERVGGVGSIDRLLAGYRQGGGEHISLERIRWWETVGTLRWAIGCVTQAKVHLSGVRRSHELAAIGRRACESEFDALQLIREAAIDGRS